MEDAQQSLNVEVRETLKLIECTICLEIIAPPVFQCANGHLVCSTCSDQITLCATCRATMPTPRIRNLVAENLLTSNCPYFKWGCKIKLCSKDKAHHILRCEYSSSDFCNRLGLGNGLQCKEVVRKCDISSHMKNEHNFQVYQSSEEQITQNMDLEIENQSKKLSHIIFSTLGDNFFLETELTPSENGSSMYVSWKMISASSAEFAKHFLVELSLHNFEEDLSLKWQGKVISVDDLQETNLKFFFVPLDLLLKQFNEKQDMIQWTLNVLIKRKPLDNFNIISNSNAIERPYDGARSQATFQFTIQGISGLIETVLSMPTYIKNRPWRILVTPRVLDTNGRMTKMSLGIFLQCNGEDWSSDWHCTARATLRILSHTPDREHCTRSGFSHNFHRLENDWGYSKFVDWPFMMNPMNGLIVNDSITVEAEVQTEP